MQQTKERNIREEGFQVKKEGYKGKQYSLVPISCLIFQNLTTVCH